MRPAQENETNKPTYHKLVLEKLSMCVALIALNTTNTCWKSSVADVINYGRSYGLHQCFISFAILKNICNVFEQKVFDQKTTGLIKEWSRDNVNVVFEYCDTVLRSQDNLPAEIYAQCLSVAKHWCKYSPKTFLVN